MLLTVNHYSSPGFPSWWLALATSAIFPVPVHWIVTAAWTSPNCLYAATVTPFSHWLFGRIARTYGFTNMPPMPPRPGEEAERARSVRQILNYARKCHTAVIGLAPEGGDTPDGVLTWPPPGSGRFIAQLSKLGFPILPAGIFEDERRLCLRFGPVYRLLDTRGLPAEAIDRQAAKVVMTKIANLLPENLQGIFRENPSPGRIYHAEGQDIAPIV